MVVVGESARVIRLSTRASVHLTTIITPRLSMTMLCSNPSLDLHYISCNGRCVDMVLGSHPLPTHAIFTFGLALPSALHYCIAAAQCTQRVQRSTLRAHRPIHLYLSSILVPCSIVCRLRVMV